MGRSLALALAGVLAAAPGSDALARSRSGTAGALVGLELGSHLGGHGVGLDYLHPLADKLSLGAHVGAGLSGGEQTLAAWEARAYTTVGRRHRLVVGLGWALLARRSLSLHGTVVDTRGVYGPTGVVGYELLADNGFFLRGLAGYGYALEVAEHPGAWVDQSLCLAVGMKLW